MKIHTMNEHPNMQANKFNVKYHLHVQHSTDARALKQEGHKCTKENARH